MVDSSDHSINRVGIEISNSALIAVCLDREGKLTNVRRVSVNPSEPTGQQLVSFMTELRESFGAFEKVGIAVPGLVDRASNRVTFSVQIPQHSDVDLARDLYAATNLAATIENDANAAAYAEFRVGAGRGSRNMFYATLGLGVG